MPYLSIIVPIYNVEPFLKQCIDSILSQTFTDFELILVDDGSPDSCPKICDEYKERDNRVKVLHKDNGGLVDARKAGLRVACGKYVGYVDGDDWIEKDMYSQLCGAARRFGTDMVICDVKYCYPDKEIKYRQTIKPGFYEKKSMEANIYPVMLFSGEYYKFGLLPILCNKIFKRELLEKNQFRIKNMICIGEDVACSYPCLLDAESIYILNHKYLYNYRQNANSITKSYDEKFIERILVLFDQLSNLLKGKNQVGSNMPEQFNYYVIYITTMAIDNEFNVQNKSSIRMKLQSVKKLLLNKDVSLALTSVSISNLPFKFKIYLCLLRKKYIAILYILIKMNRQLRKSDLNS